MRGLKLVLVLLVVAGIYCGGNKTDSAKPAGGKAATTTPGAATAPAASAVPANAAAEGFPPEAFAVLTAQEMDRYVKVLPAAGKAFQAAGYKAKQGKTMLSGIAATVDGMKDVKGLEDALKQGGMGWPEFRVTTFKVLATNTSLGIAMAEAMAASDSSLSKSDRDELTKIKTFFAGVPKENQTLVFKYMDQLKALDNLDQ